MGKGSEGQEAKSPEAPQAESFFAFAQPEELVNLSYNLFLQNKKFRRNFEGHDRLVPQNPLVLINGND